MPALESDSVDDEYDDMPALESDSVDDEYADMPQVIDLTNENDDGHDDNPLNYDFTYLNDETYKFEKITIDGVNYFHDKYGDITGCVNLLLCLDSNLDLEAVRIYSPNLNIENAFHIQY